MIRGGYYRLLSFEYIKKGKETEEFDSIGAEYPGRKREIITLKSQIVLSHYLLIE